MFCLSRSGVSRYQRVSLPRLAGGPQANLPAWRISVSRIYRSLLGLSIVALLVPTTLVAFPNLLDRDRAESDDTAVEAQEDDDLHFEGPLAQSTTAADGQHLAMETLPEVDFDDNRLPRVTPPGSTTTGDTAPEDHADHGPGTSSQQTGTTDSGSGNGGGSTAPTGEIITGSACPCTVTGTATLQGKVNLQGDLIVDGGTLIARSGVDLEGNGYQIMFMNGAKADFQGTSTSTWSGTGSDQNMKRDINFNNLKRIMFHMGAGPSTLKYFTVSNSGTSALGDYPLHWHLNGNSTRGTIVEGVVVQNSRNRAFVPHGSHGITFKGTIAKNISGPAYWWDPPGSNESCSIKRRCTIDNSNDITFDRALADTVTNSPGDNRGFRLAGFVLGAGSGNTVRDSAAININPTHVKNCAGFFWPGDANHNDGGNVWVFQNNQSHNPSGCHGIFVWQNDSNHHTIDNFIGRGIEHGAYVNSYEYRNVNISHIIIHAAGMKVIGGKVGTVSAERHRNGRTPTAEFRDVSIDRFIIQHGSKAEVPGTYVLVNTGLTCADIEVSSIVSGTKVTVDGEDCQI